MKENKSAIIILKRIYEKGVDSKTRIGKEVQSQYIANLLAEQLFECLILNLEQFEGDIYQYYPPIGRQNRNFVRHICGREIMCVCQKKREELFIKESITYLYNLGYDYIISTVADVVYFNLNYFNELFNNLNQYDVVLGLADDGGVNSFAVNKGVSLEWLVCDDYSSRKNNFSLSDRLITKLQMYNINYHILDYRFGDIDGVDDIIVAHKWLLNKLNKTKGEERLLTFIKNNFANFI